MRKDRITFSSRAFIKALSNRFRRKYCITDEIRPCESDESVYVGWGKRNFPLLLSSFFHFNFSFRPFRRLSDNRNWSLFFDLRSCLLSCHFVCKWLTRDPTPRLRDPTLRSSATEIFAPRHILCSSSYLTVELWSLRLLSPFTTRDVFNHNRCLRHCLYYHHRHHHHHTASFTFHDSRCLQSFTLAFLHAVHEFNPILTGGGEGVFTSCEKIVRKTRPDTRRRRRSW